MTGLGMMLKALGVNITPENITSIEVLVPQIPAKLQQAITTVNNALTNFDSRLKALESGQSEIIALLNKASKELEHVNTSNGSNAGANRPGRKR